MFRILPLSCSVIGNTTPMLSFPIHMHFFIRCTSSSTTITGTGPRYLLLASLLTMDNADHTYIYWIWVSHISAASAYHASISNPAVVIGTVWKLIARRIVSLPYTTAVRLWSPVALFYAIQLTMVYRKRTVTRHSFILLPLRPSTIF